MPEKKPVIVAVANQKGGIGKTTTAVAMASILNKLGHKTLLIDADQQANASNTFQAAVENTATLYDVLLDRKPVPLKEAIQHTQYSDVVAGDPLLAKGDAELSKSVEGLFLMQEALKDIDDYEFVVIDTPPALGEMMKSVLIAADEVIIPVTADSFSIDGLKSEVAAINAIKKRLNPKLTIRGLVLIAYPINTKLGEIVKKHLEETASSLGTDVLWPPIRRTIRVEEAHFAGMPVIYYDESCTAAQDYIELIQNFLEVHYGKK